MTIDHKNRVHVFPLPVRFCGKETLQLIDIADQVNAGGYNTFILDFSATTFIDSYAIGSLVNILKRLNGSQTALQLRNLNSDISEIFVTTGINSLFDINNPGKTRQIPFELNFISCDTSLNLEVRFHNDAAIICIKGVMNRPQDANYFKSLFFSVMADNCHILLDMSELSTIDRHCAGAVLDMYRLLRLTGGYLHAYCINDTIRRIFSMIAENDCFSLYANLQDALVFKCENKG